MEQCDLRSRFAWSRNKNNLLGTWLLFYYNAVLGLEAWLVTLAIGIALVVDAISDPFVGIWSDRVKTKWGRRHLLCMQL